VTRAREARADRQVPGGKGRTSLGQALGGTANSLGLLRFVLASAVIFHHAFPLGGYLPDPFAVVTRGQSSIGSLAVAGFFGISGYLIAKSGMTSDVVQFLWRRVLRLFPAYWAMLVVTAFAVGPLAWLASGRDLAGYFTLGAGGPVNYLVANWTLTIGAYGIHDLFADTTPYGRAIGASVLNGSIWTLYYEWLCYLLIAVLVALGVFKWGRFLVPVLATLLLVGQVLAVTSPGAVGAVIPLLADPFRISLTFTFLVGSTLAVYSRKVPFDDRLGVLSAVVLLLSLRFGGFATVGTVAGVYLVLYLGARLPRRLHRVGRENDYSYGIYIYGFLVQQVTASLGWYRLGYLPYALVALVLSFGLAWLSWHLVEKRFLRLKDWGPGRGWHNWFPSAGGRRGTLMKGR
jgi:peptidoglycan/LPS O-acetylase OafA/YrhL